MSRPQVVLIGPMGAGKTKVGKRVARLLGAEFTDTDRVIVAQHGPIADLFAEQGEPYFRDLERDAVAAALATGGVVSLGGGAVTDQVTLTELESHDVILLVVNARAVERRLGNGKRPLIRDGVRDWQRILDERLPLYEQVSDHQIDTSGRSHAAVAQEVAEWVRARA